LESHVEFLNGAVVFVVFGDEVGELLEDGLVHGAGKDH